MAFSGYLIKINGTAFPNKYILMDSYNSTPNQLIDDDSYTDGDGKLHRNVLSHTRSKIEFSTVPKLSLVDKMAIQAFIPVRVKLTVEYWNEESNTYQIGELYVPDITYPIHDVTATNITYNSFRIAFIEY